MNKRAYRATPASAPDDLDAGDVPVPEGADPAIAKAIEAVRDAGKLIEDLRLKAERLARERTGAIAALEHVAVADELGEGSDGNYAVATQLVQDLEAAIKRVELAQPAADRRLAEAKRSLHVVASAGHRKTFERLCKLRAEAAARLPAVLAELAKVRAAFFRADDRIRYAWPHGNGYAKPKHDDLARKFHEDVLIACGKSIPRGDVEYGEVVYGSGQKFPIRHINDFVEAVAGANGAVLQSISTPPSLDEGVSE